MQTTPNPGATGATTDRRSFLAGIGLMTLSACGGGSTDEGPSVAQAAAAGTEETSLRKALAATETPPFAHPGVLYAEADFARMVARQGSQPWLGSWNLLLNSAKVRLNYASAPLPIIYRGSDVTENFLRLVNEAAVMFGLALRWRVSGDTAYAAKATEMLNGWATTLTALQGRDRALVAGALAFSLANIAEMLRTYSGFTATHLSNVQNLLRTVFYPVSNDLLVNANGVDPLNINANWYLFCMAGVMATGILCDDRTLFDQAVTYFKDGSGNGSIRRACYYTHPGYLGQWQESGRDQNHAMVGLGAMAAVCEMAWQQGVDLYGHDNNRFLAAAEYTAKANVKATDGNYFGVPYVPYRNGVSTWNSFSKTGQGDATPCWALIYNHYVQRRGLSAPYTTLKALAIQPEGEWDFMGYGTLTFTRDAIAAGAAPSGLTGQVSGSGIVLSWWGGCYDTSYNLRRAASANGPFTVIASGITDTRTYTDTPPGDGTWYYQVTAITPSGESAPSNVATVLRAQRLHAVWRCDEGSGSVATDASGNGRDAMLNAGVTWVAGKTGSALAFNGSGGHVSLPTGLMDGISDFTISAWVYWNAARNWERVFDFGGGTDRHMFFTPRASNGRARFSMTLTGFNGSRFIESSSALPTGRWVHVAVTLAGRQGTLYVDGVAVGSNADLFLNPALIWDTHSNWLGRSKYSNDPYFNGRIDELRIYRGALSATEVQALMNTAQDASSSVSITQAGAVLNRATQKYVGSVKMSSLSASALNGPLQLVLSGLSSGVTLDQANGLFNGAPYVTLAGPLPSGGTLTVPLTFSNPNRGVIAYQPKLYQGYP